MAPVNLGPSLLAAARQCAEGKRPAAPAAVEIPWQWRHDLARARADFASESTEGPRRFRAEYGRARRSLSKRETAAVMRLYGDGPIAERRAATEGIRQVLTCRAASTPKRRILASPTATTAGSTTVEETDATPSSRTHGSEGRHFTDADSDEPDARPTLFRRWLAPPGEPIRVEIEARADAVDIRLGRLGSPLPSPVDSDSSRSPTPLRSLRASHRDVHGVPAPPSPWSRAPEDEVHAPRVERVAHLNPSRPPGASRMSPGSARR